MNIHSKSAMEGVFPYHPFVINWLPSALDCGKMKLSLHGLCVQFRGAEAKWVLFVPEPSGEQGTAGWCVFSVCTHCGRVAVKCHASSAHPALYIHIRSQYGHVIKERSIHCVNSVSYLGRMPRMLPEQKPNSLKLVTDLVGSDWAYCYL